MSVILEIGNFLPLTHAQHVQVDDEEIRQEPNKGRDVGQGTLSRLKLVEYVTDARRGQNRTWSVQQQHYTESRQGWPLPQRRYVEQQYYSQKGCTDYQHDDPQNNKIGDEVHAEG